MEHYENSGDLNLTIPELTGLVIYLDHEDTLGVFKTWNLPKLQHLYITFAGNRDEYPLEELFERDRPSLLSLALRYCGLFHLPPDVWSRVPNLLYLGSTSFELDEIVAPPNTHPLRTLGFLELRPECFPRDTLGPVLSEWNNIKVIADVHRWEEHPPFTSSRAADRHTHDDFDERCHYCIEMAHSACYQYGVRYEDLHGKSLEEFMASPGAVRPSLPSAKFSTSTHS